MTQQTDRKSTELMRRLSLHFGACEQCKQAFKGMRGVGDRVKACETGYSISMEWLENQAGAGDLTAQMYLRGLDEAAGMS